MMRSVYEWVASVIVALVIMAATVALISAVSWAKMFYPEYLAAITAVFVMFVFAAFIHEVLYK